MNPFSPGARPLQYTQTRDTFQATTLAWSTWAGVACGSGMLAFIGAGFVHLTAANAMSRFGGILFTLLIFGFIPVVMLRHQRITLNAAGLECRFLLFCLPIWRDFIPSSAIVELGSIWDEGSDESFCMRLLICTPSGQVKWGINAGDPEIRILGERLQNHFHHLQNRSR